MTLNEIMASDKEFLSPSDVAPILRCMPYSINLAARSDPEKLGFPVVLMGTRVRIPRKAFIRFIERGKEG